MVDEGWGQPLAEGVAKADSMPARLHTQCPTEIGSCHPATASMLDPGSASNSAPTFKAMIAAECNYAWCSSFAFVVVVAGRHDYCL